MAKTPPPANVRGSAFKGPHTFTTTQAQLDKVIDYIEKETGRTKADILKQAEIHAGKVKEMADVSPKLHEGHAEHLAALESALYDMFDILDPNDKAEFLQKSMADAEFHAEHGMERVRLKKPPTGAPQFSKLTFNQLTTHIIHASRYKNTLFPLKNIFGKIPREMPRFIIVPTDEPQDMKYNSVSRAAATPGGEFIFNTKLMQHMLNWAHVRGVDHPVSKCYKANGGNIPNEYEIVEFVIIHELYHFKYGDFHYTDKYVRLFPDLDKGFINQVLNYLGDFRTNHDLVKDGLIHIPDGLYSNHITLDDQTYGEGFRTVKREMLKMSLHHRKIDAPDAPVMIFDQDDDDFYVIVKKDAKNAVFDARLATDDEVMKKFTDENGKPKFNNRAEAVAEAKKNMKQKA